MTEANRIIKVSEIKHLSNLSLCESSTICSNSNININKQSDTELYYIKSKILLNSINDFSVRYDKDERNIIKNKKFVISFDDIIKLVKIGIEAQIKIDTITSGFCNILKEISSDFINNLSYHIFSFDKVDIFSETESKSPKRKRKECCGNIRNCEEKHSHELKSSSTWIPKRVAIEDEKTEEIEEIKKKRSVIKKNREKNNRKEWGREEEKTNKKPIRNSKSFLAPDISKTSLEKYKENNSNNNNCNNNTIKKNKGIEKRSNSYLNSTAKSNYKSVKTISSNVYTQKKNNNKSANKRKISMKEEKKGKSIESQIKKNSEIYTACEAIKGVKSIFSNKYHHYSVKTEAIEDNHLKGQNDNKLGFIVKKQYISKAPIPSNMANKLLLKGKQFINDFNGIKEEERKKQFYI